MKNIVGVTFNEDNNIQYYFVDNFKLKKGITIIVEDNKIERFAKVNTDIHPIDDSKLKKELGNVVRIASKNDFNKKLYFKIFGGITLLTAGIAGVYKIRNFFRKS